MWELHIFIYMFQLLINMVLKKKKKAVDLTHTNKLGKIFSYCSPVTISTIKPLNFQDFTSSGWQWSNRKWFIYVSLFKLQYSFLKKRVPSRIHKALFPATYTYSLKSLLLLLLFCILFLWNSITLITTVILFYFIYVENVLLMCIHIHCQLHLSDET